jgi:hypothetical protein
VQVCTPCTGLNMGGRCGAWSFFQRDDRWCVSANRGGKLGVGVGLFLDKNRFLFVVVTIVNDCKFNLG